MQPVSSASSSRPRRRRFDALLAAVVVALADPPAANAEPPAAAPASPGTLQLATEAPKRRRRPPLDPAARQLRQARGLLAGGIVLTTLCSVGFGLSVAAAVDRGDRLTGSSGDRIVAGAGIMLACTLVSIAGIGVGAHKLRALRSSGRIAWSGGLGFRF